MPEPSLPVSPALRRGLAALFASAVLIGCLLLWWLVGGLAWRDWRIAHDYREAQCEILDLRMGPTRFKTSKSFFGKRRTASAQPIFAFRFEVDGKMVTASGYDSLDGRDAKSADYSRFRIGEKYPCWYDPADPSKAVLVRTWRPSRYWAAVIPLGMIFMGGVLLRGVLGGPPTPVEPVAPSSLPLSPVQTNEPLRVPWKPLLIGGGIVGLIGLTVVLPIVAQQRERATWPALAAARHDGPLKLDAFGAPPGAKATGFRTVETGLKRNNIRDMGAARLAWTQPHESTADFASVAAWYSAKLGADQWRVHQAPNADSAEFCQAQWRIRLTRTATGYDLRLEWDTHFTPEQCPHT